MTDTNSPQETPAVPAEVANAAAKDLESCVEAERLDQQGIPWLYPPPGRPLTQKVTDAWFKVRIISD